MELQQLSVIVSVVLLSLSVMLAFIRLMMGPSLPDRVIALDLMSTIGIGAIAVYAFATREAVFLDVATVLALVSFLGVVAFAHYMQRREQAEEIKREQGQRRSSTSEEGSV